MTTSLILKINYNETLGSPSYTGPFPSVSDIQQYLINRVSPTIPHILEVDKVYEVPYHEDNDFGVESFEIITLFSPK